MPTLRRNIMLGTAGHVDHGKTAVVRLLTGCDTDTLSEEKQRGMTIDLGFAPCHLANQQIVGVVDVPGHADFIRNMVAGAHGIDVVILVVAADDGIMPQTREHLQILRLMGLKHGLVALNKIDLVEPARRAEVIDATRCLLRGTFLEPAPICPISALTGEGFEAFFDALNRVAGNCADRPVGGLFHLWIEDVFTIKGAGTVVTGIPTRGQTRIGDRLASVPGNVTGRVRQLQVYGEPADEGRAGECVALNLAEVSHDALRRGTVLCESGAIEPVSIVEVDIEWLPEAPTELKDNAEVRVHVGTAAQTARVALLNQPRLQPGDRQFAQIRFASPLGLVPGERFVIRAGMGGDTAGGLMTVGGGRILGVTNLRLRRQKPSILEALADQRAALDDPVRWTCLLLRHAAAPMTPEMLAGKSLCHTAEMERLLASLATAGEATPLADGRWVHRSMLDQLCTRLIELVAQFHQTHPRHEGLAQSVAQSTLTRDARLFESALTTLARDNRLRVKDGLLSEPCWSARLAPEEERECDQLVSALKSVGWITPTLADLAGQLGLPLTRIQTLARLLTERGLLAHLGEDRYIHRDSVDAVQRVALDLFARAPSFSTMDFRDALGVSRKYAVPLLDYLDSIRFTARSGNQRSPGVEARRRMSFQ